MPKFLTAFVVSCFCVSLSFAQDLDGQVERDPKGDTATYEFDSGNRIIPRGGDADGEGLDGDDRQYYDGVDRPIEEEKEKENTGGNTGGSIDPINDPEFFDDTGGKLPGEGGGSVDPINNPEKFEQCPECKKIQDKIDTVQKNLDELEAIEEELDKKQDEVDQALEDAEQALEDAKSALDDFDNPKSYAESEGRRVDSSDIAAQRWAYAHAWGAYQNGDMTAQELQDFWNDFDDADLEKAKEGYRKQLEQDIQEAQKGVDELKKQQQDLEDQDNDVEGEIEDLEKTLEKLKKDLEDCLKKCGRSWIDSFFDIFIDLGESETKKAVEETRDVLDYEYDGLDRLQLRPLPKGDFQVDSFFDVFYEIDLPEDPADVPDPLKDQVVERLGGGDFQVDSFFDVFFDIEVDANPNADAGTVQTEMLSMDLVGGQPLAVAPCPKCQSILDKLNAAQKALNALGNTLKALQAKSNKLGQAINKAQGRVDNLKDALDRMENPPSWAESNGRRVDSADLEARRAAFADAWGQYQGGSMTAQELEDYWENFDDAQRDQWKEKIKKDLRKKIQDAEKAVNDLKADKQKVEQEIKDQQAKIDKTQQQIDQFQKEYDECIKKCKDATTPPSILDGLGGWWDGIFGPRVVDIEKTLEETVELLVSPPIVLPGPADDVAPDDKEETESRMLVFENLDIYVPKGETVELVLPTTQEQIEYLKIEMENVIISDTSGADEGGEDRGAVINPEILLPGPELTTDGNGRLTVSNIGSSGEDGVSIDLGEADLEDQILNPNPSGNDYLQGFGVDTSGIGGLGGAQVIGFDEDGKRVVLRDNVRITPEPNGGARIEFDSPITVSPGRPVDIVIPVQENRDDEDPVIIDLPPKQFLPSDTDPYRFEAGPEGGVLNGSGVGQGTGNIFLPGEGSPEPPIFRFDPDGNLNPNRDLVLPDNWDPPVGGNIVLPPAGFDPIFDLGQGLGQGNAQLDRNGNLVVSNIGSSGQDGVRIDLGEDNLGSSGQDGVRGSDNLGSSGQDGVGNFAQIGHGGGGNVQVNDDGTFTYDPPRGTFGTDTFEFAQIGHGESPNREVDFFRPLILEFPDDLGRGTVPDVDFGIRGPNTFIPLDPSRMDGKRGIGLEDLAILDACLGQGGSSCDGLIVGPPLGVGGPPFSGGSDPSDFDLVAGSPDGRVFNWNAVRGSVRDFNNEARGVQGGHGFSLDDVLVDDSKSSQSLTDSFFDIEVGSLQGSGDRSNFDEVDIFGDLGSSGEDGIDLLYFGTTDRTVGLEWPSAGDPAPKPSPDPFLIDPSEDVFGGNLISDGLLDTPPPADPPPLPPKLSSLPPAVQALIRRIIQENPLGPCDELVIDVTKVRVGNQYQFTVTARIVKKPNCPKPEDDVILGDPTNDPLLGTDGLPPGEPIVRDPITPPGLLDPDGGGLIPGGDDIFVDGFETGDTTAWSNPRDDAPPPPPPSKCQVGFHNDRNCGGTCSSGQRCIHSIDEEDCYVCADQCAPNFASRESCNSTCDSDLGRCVPAGENGNCWECLRVDPALVSPCVGLGKHSTNRCDGSCSANQDCVRATTDQECYECRDRAPEPECRIDADCDDGDFCNGMEICNEGQCQSGEPIDPDDGDPCTEDFCNPEDGTISNTPIPGCGEPEPQCPADSFERAGCSRCDAGCEPVPNIDNLPCYRCKDYEPPACVPDCYGKACGDDGCGGSCGQCGDGIPCSPEGQCVDTPECVPDCTGKVCGDDGCGGSCGTCNSGQNCTPNGLCEATSVPDPTCPDGMFGDIGSCESANSQGCQVGGTIGDFQCWIGKPSCEDLCSQHGFSATPVDFSAHIEGFLNSFSCVSGYSMQIRQGRVGDCDCYDTQPPEIQVDQTVPICEGTPCGDIPCGNSASCQTGPNTTTTVTCNWGGWRKEALNKYKPVLGIVE